MELSMTEVIQALFIGIPIAVVSSWVTVRLSIRQFKSQRWWEKKVETYERVIGAFHNSKRFASEYIKFERKGKDISEERSAELIKQSKVARDEISRASDIGRFLISDKAVSILANFEKEAENQPHYDTWWEYLAADWSLVHRHMTEFIAEAQRDLQK